MAGNDNSRADLIEEELGAEDATTDDTEDTSADDDTSDDTEDTSADDSDDESTEGDEDDAEGDEDEDDDEAAEKAKYMKKFEGKTPEEIIDMYRNLEKRLGKRAISNGERKALKEHGVTKKDLATMEDLTEDLKKEIAETDFSKMKPGEFAEWIIRKLSVKARQDAAEIYRNASTVQNAVRTEISQATEKHPLLKTNKEYRDLVLAIIESGQGRGEHIPLLEACAKVDGLIGQKAKVDDKDKRKLKSARTAVESTERTVNDSDGEEEKIKKGILAAGVGDGIL